MIIASLLKRAWLAACLPQLGQNTWKAVKQAHVKQRHCKRGAKKVASQDKTTVLSYGWRAVVPVHSLTVLMVHRQAFPAERLSLTALICHTLQGPGPSPSSCSALGAPPTMAKRFKRSLTWRNAVQTACGEVCASLKHLKSNKHTEHQAWLSVEPLVDFKENQTEWGDFSELIKYCFGKNDHLGERWEHTGSPQHSHAAPACSFSAQPGCC